MTAPRIRYHLLSGSTFLPLLVVGLVLVAVGGYAAHRMESLGHVVTGMDNQVVWGLPHVFAVALILAASGALNVASLVSVFRRDGYPGLSRLSALSAIALLLGGLFVLVLDLGRPDRLVIALTTWNFRSVFAWNIFLYTGFFAVVTWYLYTQFEPRSGRFTRLAGTVALVWRLALTTGTGAIFGFLVARQAYDAAIMSPLFISLSLALGSAVFILVLEALARVDRQPLPEVLARRLGRMLALTVLANAYFVATAHLANLYVAEHHGIERFLLLDGGIYPVLFWGMQVVVGTLVPLLLVYRGPGGRSWTGSAALAVIAGAFAQLYVIIIGGQAYPLALFPGADVSSRFFDGAVAHYWPSWTEAMLGVGGIAVAALVMLVAMRVLPFLPERFGQVASATGAKQPAVDGH